MTDNILCEYNCGNVSKYQLKNGKWCCSNDYKKCPNIRRKNSDSVKKLYKENKKNCNHLEEKRNWSKNKLLIPIDKVFCNNSNTCTKVLKKYLIKLNIKEDKCEICGLNKWLEKTLTIVVHHIDGNRRNNELNNLQLLCPNCHSQTDNFSGRNKFKIKLSQLDTDVIINMIKNSKSIRDVLMNLNVAVTSKSYEFIKKIMKDNNVTFKAMINTCKICGKKISKKAKKCKRCAKLEQPRKVSRPSKEILEKEIQENSFVALGKKYGVSDNAIRKWCKSYNIL